ncbi:hypothetical protein RJT34_07113 [Clitoria ternatea]|uniref:Uncharacterized protein n=1 Tax=Clitoria ternatea TaxID=43366 RepID=A0AAN9K2B8_CLITE
MVSELSFKESDDPTFKDNDDSVAGDMEEKEIVLEVQSMEALDSNPPQNAKDIYLDPSENGLAPSYTNS